MEKLKLTIHPLFFVLGFIYALCGRIFLFAVYTLSAVVHELGHSIVAENRGYRLKQITLMPFGAVVKSSGGKLRYKDEVAIALAGPFVNLAVGLFFVAVWWIFPEIYAWTDVVAEANFSLAIVNLIPAYPLDGGRVVNSIIALKFGEQKSIKICKLMSLVFAICLSILFVLTLFYSPNFSLLLFASFVLFGVFNKDKDCVYIKMKTVFSLDNLKRGIEYKKFAVDKSVKLNRIMKIIDKNAINEVVVFDGGKAVAKISQEQLNQMIEKADIYTSVENFL